MRFLFVLLVSSIIGAQAQALSCERPNSAKVFNWYQDSPDTYRIVVGTLKMTGRIPNYVQGVPRTAKARVTGKYVGKTGLTPAQSFDVSVQTTCVAVWCGNFPTEREMVRDVVLYVKQSSKGPIVEIDACPNGFGQIATDDRVKVLQGCLRKGRCSKADISRLEQN